MASGKPGSLGQGDIAFFVSPNHDDFARGCLQDGASFFVVDGYDQSRHGVESGVSVDLNMFFFALFIAFFFILGLFLGAFRPAFLRACFVFQVTPQVHEGG